MHAALILLDLNLALRTGFGVQFDPNLSVILPSLESLHPFLEEFTVNRPVSFLQALETPVITTFAYYVCLLLRGILSSVAAIRSWTPFGLLVHVHERFDEELLVSLELPLVEQ